MNDKMSQFIFMNNVVTDKKGHNILNDSIAQEQEGLLVIHYLRDRR